MLDAWISYKIYEVANQRAANIKLVPDTAIPGLQVDLLLGSYVVCARGVLRVRPAQWGEKKMKTNKWQAVVEVKEVLVPGARTQFPCVDGKWHALRDCGPGTAHTTVLWRVVLLRRRHQ